MRSIELPPENSAKLRALGFLDPSLAIVIHKWLPPGEDVYLIPTNICEEIRSSLTELLAKVGFDKDYNLTDKGKDLEDLIGRFSGL